MLNKFVRKDLGEWYYKIQRVENRGDDPCMELTFRAEVLAKNLLTKKDIQKLTKQLKKQMRAMMRDGK